MALADEAFAREVQAELQREIDDQEAKDAALAACLSGRPFSEVRCLRLPFGMSIGAGRARRPPTQQLAPCGVQLCCLAHSLVKVDLPRSCSGAGLVSPFACLMQVSQHIEGDARLAQQLYEQELPSQV